MGLFKPGWMSKDENKAMRSLDRVSDDEELYRIATECPHLNVQIRAVSRIRDADRRLDVALTKRLISLNVRRAALEGGIRRKVMPGRWESSHVRHKAGSGRQDVG